MNCELAQTAVHGYFDGELDAVRAAEFEEHLGTCEVCQASLDHLQSFRNQLQGSGMYEQASRQLRGRVRQGIEAETVSSSTVVGARWRKFLVPACGVLTVALLAVAFFSIQSRRESTRLTAEVLDAHVRSLQPGHLTDVLSTDQHTVKPWFDGKLEFIPPVTDYSAQGFPLVGGRLDVLDGRNVAALVYSRRKHIINVFVWPLRDGESSVGITGSRQGYNWILWTTGEMQYCVISDVSEGDLQQLSVFLRQ